MKYTLTIEVTTLETDPTTHTTLAQAMSQTQTFLHGQKRGSIIGIRADLTIDGIEPPRPSPTRPEMGVLEMIDEAAMGKSQKTKTGKKP